LRPLAARAGLLVFKHRVEKFSQWLRELPKGKEEDGLFRENWRTLEAQMKAGLEDDTKHWAGWLSRHGGVM
jgi:hypothetical protein